ncbi:hypothetical protein SAMN05660649_00326 [Desulfotomaculum arcticum]|uniref:Uncharacterized protein n=1 Tax=Desulfotruncus arcticus DSM 17038 TaxID=1121424 RepID=A0A1I2N9J8_9FIRM|nr:hypothetical protein [Desulfotruncus arcticus]SFF98176.1 hypothetical protein SAMN05660649_00326 [Desulfotomaculum arcticum] [Desulfotruncus arcticus DSM 17038]
MDIKITQMSMIDKDEYEVKMHFEFKGNSYFGILNLKSGAFISNLVNVSDEDNHEVLHYLGHQAEEFLEENGIAIPQDFKCGCSH